MSAADRAPDTSLRIIFAGTPEFARIHLEALLGSPHQIVGVYTQPDRAAGRGKKPKPSPVKQCALKHAIPVFQPVSLKQREAQAELSTLAADVMVVVAYGLLLPQAVLDIPRLGCINVHASLLPRWRGAAPVERAIAAGDRETGVTIMQMDAGLDTGPMLCRRRCSIDEDTTGDTLRQRLAELGGAALFDTLQQLCRDVQRADVQDDALSNYAPKLQKSEAWIDWSDDAHTIARKVRAFCSANVAVTNLGEQRVKVWMAHAGTNVRQQQLPPGTIVAAGKDSIEVACGKGVVHITRLQLPGGKPLDVGAVLNARRALFAPGTRLHD